MGGIPGAGYWELTQGNGPKGEGWSVFSETNHLPSRQAELKRSGSATVKRFGNGRRDSAVSKSPSGRVWVHSVRLSRDE